MYMYAKSEDRDKKLKKVIEEGGKLGVALKCDCDKRARRGSRCDLELFCTWAIEPEGDVELAAKSMEAMNAKSDPTDEERKGGSGHIGRMLFSMGVHGLAVVAYVPEENQATLNCEELLKNVLDSQCGQCGTIITKGKSMSIGIVTATEILQPIIRSAVNFLSGRNIVFRMPCQLLLQTGALASKQF